MVAPRFHRLTVADIRRETADAVSLAFAVPARLRPAFAFLPGQYLTLQARLGGTYIRRCYSICSGLDDGELRIAVKRVPGGVFSTCVNETVAAGDPIEAMPPLGQFTTPLRPEAARVFVGLACGSGITPILSLLKSVLTREPRSRFFLLYGNRTSREIMFAEELARLKDRHLDRLSVTHVLSREAQELPALHGRLDAGRIGLLLQALLPDAAIDHAFICGPAAMMDDAGVVLAGLGVSPERIHREYFTMAGEPVRAALRPAATEPGPAATADIMIDGRRHRIALPEGESVIEAGLAAGLDLPYSCRAGMCCTCRARLIEGKVEMAANYSLQPWEIAAGFVLTCQARPLTPHLVLDYDAV